MPENTFEPSSVTPDAAVKEVLDLYPKLAEHREQLLSVIKLRWRGEWPLDFFKRIAGFVDELPWLGDQLRQWIDPAILPVFNDIWSYAEHYRNRSGQWDASVSKQSERQPTQFRQFEGLLLLSELQSGPGQNEIAHRLLARVLDQIEKGLRSGNPVRLHRHPLKDVFWELGRPQTSERLAHSLNTALRKTTSMYPKVGEFLTETAFQLAIGNRLAWVPPPGFSESDVLDADKPPHTQSDAEQLVPLNDLGREALLPTIQNRPFEAADLPNEMLAIAGELTSYKNALATISNAWRGEDTWGFYEEVGRAAHWVKWLVPLLDKKIDPLVFRALRKSTENGSRRRYSRKEVSQWRERNGLEPRGRTIRAPFALEYQGAGTDPLKGLLLLGRLNWDPQENPPGDTSLVELISVLDSHNFERRCAKSFGRDLEPPHPIQRVLDESGKPTNSAEMASLIERILTELDTVQAQLIGGTYLPLLGLNRAEALPKTPLPITLAPKKLETVPKKKKKKSTQRSTVKNVRVQIPTRQTPLTGESNEETTPGRNFLRRSEPNTTLIPLKEEIRWAHQHIYGSNQLLVRNHIESLSDAESDIFAQALDARILSAIKAQDAASGWLGIVIALTLITGRGVGTWTTVLSQNGQTKVDHNKPQLLIHEGIFRLPVIRPHGAFKPDDTMQNLLEPSGLVLDLHLPPTIRKRVECLLEFGPPGWSEDEGELRRSLEALIAELEPSVGTGISLARVRRVARARIRETTHDLAATMILCGDTFGLSTAPLYYTSSQTAKLEQAFRDSAWPLFNDLPTDQPDNTAGRRVGAELLVTQDTARALARSPSAPMHAAGKKKLTTGSLISDHNHLVNHMLCMLMGAAGHRPTSALFDLKRFDFDSATHSAVFADKQCDPAHLFRFVPTADLVSVQMEKYLTHLRGLNDLAGIKPETASYASKAVEGHVPLFFHLQSDTRPLILEFDTWRKTLPPNWQVLPLNWGRTWLASRGRDAGIDSDYLSIALGHLDAAGYPYSSESPLEPAGLSRAVSGALGNLARSSGWVARNGLASNLGEEDKLLELGPLKDWILERKKLAMLSRDYEIEQRQVLRSALLGKREEGEKIALSALKSIVQTSVPEFDYFLVLRRKQKTSAASSADQETSQPITLTAEDLERIQSKIDEETPNNKVLSIAGHNALYRYLKNASKLLSWDCPFPSPWLAPATLEPTPFFDGVFRASNQVRAIRDHFGSIPVKAPEDRSFSQFEWACGQAIIALCVFGFIDDLDQVLKILHGRRSGVRTRTIPDLLFVETGEDLRVVGIRGLAAISIARIAKQFPNDKLPKDSRLNEVVAAQLPTALTGSKDDVLDRLCATISVANIVELSGLARTALDRHKGSIAMPTARQRQMLEEGHGLTTIAPQVTSISDAMNGRASKQKSAPIKVREQYKQLRNILHIGDGPKTFKLTETQLSQANIGAFRNPLVRELEAFLAQDDLRPLVACIGAYALHMTNDGTTRVEKPAWTTVYAYITSFGLELALLTGDVDFLSLEAEEFVDIFQDVIDRKRFTENKVIAARDLVKFHEYLQQHHDLESVDFSDLEGIGKRVPLQVDAEVIQPQEFAQGMVLLSARASVLEQEDMTTAESLRAHRQAEVYALLLRYSGARHNELTALRFKDVLATADSIILLIRPSRYRRLKTSSARRMVDISERMTPQQRVVVSSWIEVERARLGASWKPTLPILSKMGAPKDRASSNQLRDITLSAMEGPVGYRTKIHRARHLVAGEDMLAIWLSDTDWSALLAASTYSQRHIGGFRRVDIVLPRHVRERSLRFGHRKISTTVANYFHMPWATTSRPHQALEEYLDSHAAAVALGSGSSNTYKIGYRANKRTPSPNANRSEPGAAWLTHIAGEATPTPGATISFPLRPNSSQHIKPLGARIAESVLKDIQRGLPPNAACLAHGLTAEQLDRLLGVASEIQKLSGFKILPEGNSRPRKARAFQEAKSLEGILDLMDRDASDADRQLVLAVSHSYLLWASKSERSDLSLPAREANRLVQLLTKLGLSQAQVKLTPSAEPNGLTQIQLMRSEDPNKLMNHALAWLLVVADIVDKVNDP